MGLDWSALAKIDWWRLVWMNLAIAALVGGTVFLFAHFVLGSPTPKAEQDVEGAGPLPFRRAKPLSLSEAAGSKKGKKKKKSKNKPASKEEQGGSQFKGLSAEELAKEEADLVKQIEAAQEMLRLDDEKKELVQKLRRRAPRPESSGAE